VCLEEERGIKGGKRGKGGKGGKGGEEERLCMPRSSVKGGAEGRGTQDPGTKPVPGAPFVM